MRIIESQGKKHTITSREKRKSTCLTSSAMSTEAKIALHTAQDMLCQLNPSFNRSNSSTNLTSGASRSPSRGYEKTISTENNVQTVKIPLKVDNPKPGRFILAATLR